jgi:TolB-like protein/Tfp pilus assembly protein PilF
MFTDMVGYTALMQEDEQKAKQNRDRHRQILEESIAAHRGKLLQYFGDGTLSIFNSSIEAIDCAIRIQTSLQETPKIPLRIGLHTGDIVYDDEGIYGDGVNVASRIEGLAVAGSILISGKVYDDIKNHQSISTLHLGAFDLKNVKASVEVYAITNEGLDVPDKAEFRSKQKIKENSLAILPFASFSSDPESEFFSDGISEAIINVLAQVDGLFVTARTSSFAFKGQNKDIRELGKILGVVYILEGSVQIFRNKIRVTAQLIETQSGFHIFSEAYDRELIDVFSIQDEIAWLIAEKLKKKVRLEETRLFSSPRTKSMEALEYYAKGMQLLNTGDHPNILKAINMFEESIASDPDFVLPYTGICTCYTFLGAWGFMDETESNSKSSAYALKALEKDPNHPRALVVHTMNSFWINHWDLKTYETGIKKALKIAPGSADVRLMHGVYMLMQGRIKEAVAEILLAKELDPLNSNILTRLGYAYLCHREFEKARDFFRGAHALAKMDLYYQFLIVWSYLLQEQYDQAEDELRKVEDNKDGYRLKPGTQGFLHARQGRMDQAREKLALIKKLVIEGRIKFPHLNLTILYAGMNMTDEVFYHLEKTIQERPISLMFIQADPFWEKYRSDRRFGALLRKVFHK